MGWNAAWSAPSLIARITLFAGKLRDCTATAARRYAFWLWGATINHFFWTGEQRMKNGLTQKCTRSPQQSFQLPYRPITLYESHHPYIWAGGIFCSETWGMGVSDAQIHMIWHFCFFFVQPPLTRHTLILGFTSCRNDIKKSNTWGRQWKMICIKSNRHWIGEA